MTVIFKIITASAIPGLPLHRKHNPRLFAFRTDLRQAFCTIKPSGARKPARRTAYIIQIIPLFSFRRKKGRPLLRRLTVQQNQR